MREWLFACSPSYSGSSLHKPDAARPGIWTFIKETRTVEQEHETFDDYLKYLRG